MFITDGEEGNRNVFQIAHMKGLHSADACTRPNLNCLQRDRQPKLCVTCFFSLCLADGEGTLKIPGCLLLIVLAYTERKSRESLPTPKLKKKKKQQL